GLRGHRQPDGAPADRGRGAGVPARARGPGPADGADPMTADASLRDAPRPYTLIAELTYRCPLSCAYCSNPLQLGLGDAELTTDDWSRVFAEAAALGVLQVNLTGGEPLVRPDLEALVASARKSDLYINLITSGIPADAERLARLVGAGL